ncbi:hypothetical protein HanXRQr2_Chr09g0416441 [Helianthus annuus]|uniref:Uncharacterized protein n=1 Tax=Helianthus annuus TaxID=4232 RepID=A0A9K3IAX5_HELAN|nr:hypothetical protein HanXRQr2_Chr09g0416441 [Helianthus annuus]KAJ0537069.1 hypothetical protein HanIR_Chr09g0448681 [Helianthus annuus]KAJ0544620.1 hypothetical protein HanHA89_Chr09g0363671 [Helianthus annuus]
MPFERVAWLRLLGVLLHLVDSDVLKMVGEEFGKVLHVQKSFGEDKDLSVVRIGVLAGDVERIKEFVTVKWINRSFRIWVEKELDICVSDCLGVVEGVNPAVSSPMASSPVGRPAEPGSSGDCYVEDEEVRMGEGAGREVGPIHSLSKEGGAGEVPNVVCINWQSFVDPCAGNVSNDSGTRNMDIHYFKAGRKTKRFRKGGPKSKVVCEFGQPHLG